jgi:hypothetical protein
METMSTECVNRSLGHYVIKKLDCAIFRHYIIIKYILLYIVSIFAFSESQMTY